MDPRPIDPAPAAATAHYDGRSVLFSITADGRDVACAISLLALQDLSERRLFKPADLMKSFAAARGRIEAVALRKLQARANSAPALLRIWSDDLDAPLPRTLPASAEAAS